MTKNLMIFAIGPVQEFIATARRSRDLWYGSWMLSELSKAAAKRIIELSGELIFPSPSEPGALDPASKFTSPNKIVAILEGDPMALAEDEDAGIHRAVRSRLDELWMDARRHVQGVIADDVAEEQIRDLLEFYWVSVPLEGTGDYGRARKQAEALMAARKATRNFEQPKLPSNAPKSSLDGARESVIPRDAYPERTDPQDVQDERIENLYLNYHARRGEQLSGVDLLKRLGAPKSSPNFDSTSDIAALPFIEWLDKNQDGAGKKLLDDIRGERKKYVKPEDDVEQPEDSNGLVFERRYAESLPLQELTETQRRDFENILKKYAGRRRPNQYYALIAADGDFMGKVIDSLKTKEGHQKISEVLADFAILALEIVKGYQGVPIYSGGDDVLAYLPLNSVLQYARELQFKFRTLMGEFKVVDRGIEIHPTLSIGIVIVHHLEPLSDALELVRKAEKDAKSIEGKNGLAIILSKRSGADRPIKDKFEALNKRLEKLIEWHGRDAISGGAAYELLELHRTLSKTAIPAEGMAAEAARIIARKRESGSAEKVKEEVKNAFKDWIETVELDELAREMIVARTLAGKQEAE